MKSPRLTFKKTILLALLLPIAAVPIACATITGTNASTETNVATKLNATPNLEAATQTLKTPNYQITITQNCAEGTVVCNTVSYASTHLQTGVKLNLMGKTVHTTCADQVTPCRFLGYRFQDGNAVHFVGEDGAFQIHQGDKLMVSEAGTWNY